MLFEGKSAIVTGAGSGIGRATALRLAAEGASVLVADVSEPGGRAVAEEITAAGQVAEFVHCDVADEASVDAAVQRAVTAFGGLDLAVNNAGMSTMPQALHETSVADWDHVLAVDLRGMFLCLRAELAVMVAAGSGSIVNMASAAGLKNAPSMPAYTAAKHGAVGLTKNAALEYARQGIRVNAVCPGTIATPAILGAPEEFREQWAALVPMGRLGRPEEVAEAVAWLLSDRAGFVTGAALAIDGGFLYD